MRKAMFFNNTVLAQPNTFIGGVGTTYITTPASFAALTTTLVASDIKNFNIDLSNNVSFYVEKNYGFLSTAFISITELTYFIDSEGWCISAGRFLVTSNNQYAYFPNTTNLVSQQPFVNNFALLNINLESLLNSSDRQYLGNAENLKKLDLRSMTQMSNGINSFSGLDRLERLYIGNCTTLSQAALDQVLIRNPGRGATFLSTGSVSGNLKVYHSVAFGVANRKAFTRLSSGWNTGDTVTINGLVYTCVSGSPVNDGEFQFNASSNTTQSNLRSAINLDTRIGNISSVTAINDNAFMAVYCDTVGASGNAIEAIVGVGNTGSGSVDWSPFKYGNDVHHSLVDMRDIEGATLIEVNSIISVDPPTSLSFSNQTATSVDLNFTPPTANANGIDVYEVWVDDGSVFRKWFEYDEITATGDTLDLTGISQSGTKIKIRTMDGQMNYSVFSNEITLP